MMILPLAGSTYESKSQTQAQQVSKHHDSECTYETQDTHGQCPFATACATKQTDSLLRLEREGYPVQGGRKVGSILDRQVLDDQRRVLVRAGRRRPVRRRAVRLDDRRGFLRQVEVLYNAFDGAAEDCVISSAR